MSLILTLNGSLAVTSYSQKASATFNETPVVSGSNYVANSINLPTGSWCPIPTGSNQDLRMATFANNSTSSYVTIALNQTGSFASVLWPDDSCVLTYTGSAQVYAKCVGTQNPTPLTYIIASYN